MVRKKDEASSNSAAAKGKGGDGSKAGGKEKKERISVSSLLSNMDKPKPEKVVPKPARKEVKAKEVNAYTAGIDLPPSDDEDEGMDSDEEAALALRRGPGRTLDLSVSERFAKKKEKKEMIAERAALFAKQEAMKDDRDAFSVVIGTRAALLEGEDVVDTGAKDIKLDSFSVSARGKVLLQNASITIVHGRRYGLVGPNGTGKSTFLKLLAWRQIPVPKNIDVLLVEQEVVGDDRSALEAVVSADEKLVRLRMEAARLQSVGEASTGGDGDDAKADEAGEMLVQVYEQMQAMGSDAAESRASKILAGLGFTVAMQGRSTKSFSGGWRMRISLARALFMQPTLLLLDEPTNHLDLRAVIWLEEYLMRWKKTLIVVSHDREFLNSVSSDIIHLCDHKLLVYRGNYVAFEDMFHQKCREKNKTFEVYEKRMKAAMRSGNRASQDRVRARARYAIGNDAKSKGKSKYAVADDDLDYSPREPPVTRWRGYVVEFHFPEPTELLPPLLQLIDVGFGYPSRPDFALHGIDVGVDMGTRVAIVGPNGAGKSTLLNLLAGDLTPTEGESRQSQKLRVGRYSQHFVDSLTMDETPVQYLLRLHPDQEGPSKQETVRGMLGKFGLPSHNHLTPIVKLSGGQKARVVFTSISMAQPHILLLDEPTNHLDMQSIDALADALDEFVGGVVLVSHDARLISRVCEDEERSEIWVVEDGTVRKYPGSFDEYKSELIKEIAEDVSD